MRRRLLFGPLGGIPYEGGGQFLDEDTGVDEDKCEEASVENYGNFALNKNNPPVKGGLLVCWDTKYLNLSIYESNFRE